ncbi:MAG: hypothetical protein P4L41_04510 [Flavipsychrobacter sp.]|nr:hypothetical protein [Flavipsychrobacter sp.]
MNTIPSYLIAIILLAGIVLFYLLGLAIGSYQKRNNPDAKAEGVGPLESSLLGLLALLLSFTFSMSASRYDVRRSLIVTEANNISTAIVRADLYPDTIRTAFRKDLKQYVDTRIAYYEVGNDDEKIKKERLKAEVILSRLWQRATRLSVASPAVVRDNQMIPALNSMGDMVTSRDAARVATVPDSIITLLVILTLLGSFIIGYCKKEKKNDWVMFSIYTIMMVVTIYTIIDLDRPRTGFITTDKTHMKMLELREMFDQQ